MKKMMALGYNLRLLDEAGSRDASSALVQNQSSQHMVNQHVFVRETVCNCHPQYEYMFSMRVLFAKRMVGL